MYACVLPSGILSDISSDYQIWTKNVYFHTLGDFTYELSSCIYFSSARDAESDSRALVTKVPLIRLERNG